MGPKGNPHAYGNWAIIVGDFGRKCLQKRGSPFLITLTGPMVLDMVAGALAYMERDEARINALNVFPVPDGDTGTNMILTVKAAWEAARRGGNLSEVCEAMAMGALRGARGNSGTIVSQFFQGFYLGVQGLVEANAYQVAVGLQRAAECAYASVLEPREGTILTVGRRGAEAAVKAADRGASVIDVIQAALTESSLALDETIEMLDVLKQAGVVDAGGEGLVVGLKGALAVLSGETISMSRPASPSIVVPTEMRQSASYAEDPHRRMAIHLTDDITFQYCTEFLVRGKSIPIDEIKERCAALGDSLLVVGSEQLVKVHVHTNRPGRALEIGSDYGELLEVSVENMKEQNKERATTHQVPLDDRPTYQVSIDASQANGVSVIAVIRGEGFEKILAEQGVTSFVHGGQSVNPSVGELTEAIEAAPTQQVILLPNNSNVALAAKQAAQLSSKNVVVVPTQCLPHAVAATFDWDPQQPIEEIAHAMNAAVAKTRVAEITRAVRAASINGFTITADDFLGLANGEIVAVGRRIDEVLAETIKALNPEEGELITLYSGEDVSQEASHDHQRHVKHAFPDCDVELYYGGQPIYHYCVSVE